MASTVLRKMLPRRLKSLIRRTIRSEVEAHLATIPRDAPVDKEAVLRDVEASLRAKGFAEVLMPNRMGSSSYVLPKVPETTPGHCCFHESSPLPIPPKDLWVGYGANVEAFLALGRDHIGAMRRIIAETGGSVESAGRILDFGCATGRMIRWLHDLSDTCEIWGTDINSLWVTWCKQYLNPPFHFAASPTVPHLPFEDRYFGLIYAGSVFTHIDDLADAWFLELRRILRPGGRLYITVHDQVTIEKAEEWPDDNWLLRFLHSCPEYASYRRSNFGMFAVGRGMFSQVFYDVDYLTRKLGPFFKTLDVSVGAHGHQTAILFERL
jgi:SAM-dependent methyltransferase